MRIRFKNKETTSFKKRQNCKVNQFFFKFTETSLILSKSSNIEYNYISYFKKVLKKFFKFKKTKLKKVWIFLNKNFPITKKSKNSRMGKGKGKVVRYCMKTCNNYVLFEFSGFNIKSLLRVKKLFSFKLKTHMFIFSNFLIKKNNKFFQKSESMFKHYYRNI